MSKMGNGGLITGVIFIALIIAAIIFITDNGSLPVGPNISQSEINSIDVLQNGTAIALNIEQINVTGDATVTVFGTGAGVNIVGGGGGGGSSIEGQNNLTPVVPTISAINAGNGLEGVDSGSGVLTLNVITPTPAPTSTPAPTATPGAGGGSSCLTPVQGPALPFGATPTSSNFSGVPGVQFDVSGGYFPISGDIYYEPFIVTCEININRISIERLDANPVQDCSVGIYEVDEFWQPATLMVDFSPLTLAASGAAWNHKTVNYDLAPGSYVSAWLCAGAQIGAQSGNGDFTNTISNVLGGGIILKRWSATAPSITNGTPFPATPASGDNWDSYILSGSSDFQTWTLFYRWTVN